MRELVILSLLGLPLLVACGDDGGGPDASLDAAADGAADVVAGELGAAEVPAL